MLKTIKKYKLLLIATGLILWQVFPENSIQRAEKLYKLGFLDNALKTAELASLKSERNMAYYKEIKSSLELSHRLKEALVEDIEVYETSLETRSPDFNFPAFATAPVRKKSSFSSYYNLLILPEVEAPWELKVPKEHSRLLAWSPRTGKLAYYYLDRIWLTNREGTSF
jgi:hypothetical protein